MKHEFIGKAYLANDEFYHYKDWPSWARLSFFKPHKNRSERFHLWLFFWANGMRAERATYWVMYHRTYDQSAWRSMADLENQTRCQAGLKYLNNFPVYDMIKQQVVKGNTLRSKYVKC